MKLVLSLCFIIRTSLLYIRGYSQAFGRRVHNPKGPLDFHPPGKLDYRSPHIGAERRKDMEKINRIKKLSKIILSSGSSPLFLGDRGLGKTTVAFDIAKELGLNVHYINVSQYSSENFVFPVVKDNNNLDFLSPDFDNSIIILDEITNRNPELHSLLQSLVLEKKLGNRVYKNLYFIATGNRLENSSLVVDLPRPLIERFVLLDFPVPSIEEWGAFTLQKGGSIKYINFISSIDTSVEGNKFYYKEENSGESNLEQSPSPRSNTRSAILVKQYDLEEGIPDDTVDYSDSQIKDLKDLIAGSSGLEVANEFVRYVKNGRYYNYEMFKKGIKPKNQSELISLLNSSLAKLKEGSIDLEKFDREIIGFIDENHKNFLGYALSVLKMYVDKGDLFRFIKNNKGSVLAKIVERRNEVMKNLR